MARDFSGLRVAHFKIARGRASDDTAVGGKMNLRAELELPKLFSIADAIKSCVTALIGKENLAVGRPTEFLRVGVVETDEIESKIAFSVVAENPGFHVAEIGDFEGQKMRSIGRQSRIGLERASGNEEIAGAVAQALSRLRVPSPHQMLCARPRDGAFFVGRQRPFFPVRFGAFFH